MFGRRSGKQQGGAVPNNSAIPDGCHGHASVESWLVPQGSRSEFTTYKTNVGVKFACPGLMDGVILVHEKQISWSGTDYYDVNRGEGPTTADYARAEARRMEEAGVYIVAKCATCPLGPLGQQREEATLRAASRDELEMKLRIAEAERDALALRAQLELGAAATQSEIEAES